ncbi:MAG: DUF4145 domain-containing protein [Myxococcales bacterium]|nr:MAG: DUF4145 domain-containing protein [Myxococcales bacterium]
MPNITVDGNQVSFDRKPDTCPVCHHAVEPKETSASALTGSPASRGTYLEIVFRCPRYKCSRLIIGRYQKTVSQGSNMTGDFRLQQMAPTSVKPPTLFPEIERVSPAFVKIYAEAATAEAYNLGEIAGVGYRKALEFLIKDFCISEDPPATDEIRKEFLGACVEKRVTDENIKQCSKRAVWLGNDETHYVRRWEEKDIRDLKTLIELTMGWIRSVILTKQYLLEMTDGTSQDVV